MHSIKSINIRFELDDLSLLQSENSAIGSVPYWRIVDCFIFESFEVSQIEALFRVTKSVRITDLANKSTALFCEYSETEKFMNAPFIIQQQTLERKLNVKTKVSHERYTKDHTRRSIDLFVYRSTLIINKMVNVRRSFLLDMIVPHA